MSRVRQMTAVAMLTAAVSVMLPMSAPAGAAPVREDPSIGTAIRALRAELGRTSDPARASLDGWLAKAAQAEGDTCATAAALQEFAGQAPESLAREGARIRGRLLGGMTDSEGCDGPISVYVDPDIGRPGVVVPGFAESTPRQLADLVDSEGVRSTFVADELIVSATDDSRVQDLVNRLHGKVLHRTEPIEADGPSLYLLRIDPGQADPATLSDDLAKLNGENRKAEALAVSNETGLRLLAAAAAAAGDQLTVGVNWVDEPNDIANHTTTEAGFGIDGFKVDGNGYTRNSNKWTYLSASGAMGIGVAEAWTLLDSAGLLDNKVPIGVVDAGYAPAVNGDLPSDIHMLTVNPGTPPSAAGAFPPSLPILRWHGTHVADAAAGVPHNFIGVAGPAGPVAKLNLVRTHNESFSMALGLLAAKVKGSKIINVSLSGHVHWAMAWTLLPVEGATIAIRRHGTLIYASAGNEGIDVDAKTCFITCWEKAKISPCESAGVRCVGGVANAGRERHPLSNHGAQDVEIYGPFEVLSGADPENPSQATAIKADGTSFASPFVAGVAALIWAANPQLSATQVDQILLQHRQPSPDPIVDGRMVNALDAIRDVLPPMVRITSPLPGQELSIVTPTQFQAAFFDDGLGNPTLTWRSDGVVMGAGASMVAQLPPGAHTISVTADFPGGLSISDSLNVKVVNFTPEVHLTGPAPGGVFGQTEPIAFHATSLDDAGPLPDGMMRWYLDGQITPFATGHNPTVSPGAAPGAHTVTVRGCDTFNLCGAETINITVIPDTQNKPPVVKITNPLNGTKLWVNGNDGTHFWHQLTLTGTVTDPEGGAVTRVWRDNGTVVSAAVAPVVRLAGGCGDSTHTISLTATDAAGNTRQDVTEVMVSMIC